MNTKQINLLKEFTNKKPYSVVAKTRFFFYTIYEIQYFGESVRTLEGATKEFAESIAQLLNSAYAVGATDIIARM